MSSDKQADARQVLRDPLMLAAFGFGTGLSPKAPGTAGTLVGVLFFWFMQDLDLLHFSMITAGFFVAGIGLCGHATHVLGVHDHGGIVWDEVVGYLVTMLPVLVLTPQAAWLSPAVLMLLGFVVFRVFDIIKPPPIRWADKRIHGGFGIMFDDLLAGVYAAAVMALLLLKIPAAA